VGVLAAVALHRLRIAWYRRQWTCADVRGRPQLRAPVMLAGQGRISFEQAVTLGWELAPGFLSGYSYLEARYPGSSVTIGEGTHLNNCVTIVSEGPGVSVGRSCLFGPCVHVYDSDFHPLDATTRETAVPERARVVIGDEVFLGTGAIVLKGVTLGARSVVGAGAVVGGDVPEGAVVAGNPAKVLTR
jgi:acetyltransferase-like isoleucine patch superfamily enzyme